MHLNRQAVLRALLKFPALLTAVVLAPGLALGQEPSPITLETYTLANGLRVTLAPDPSAQVVAVSVWYNVGSRDEARGRTGFAHLFEHMMFQGSANVDKAEHFQLVERAGGDANGTTSEDRTSYYQVLPSNRLNLGLWLEADRMRSLAITDENFDNQREAVKEERRLRVDNQPYTSAIFEGMYLLADSSSCFPYAHSIIGSMADLDAAKTPDVQAFFDQYYAPNNASLVVAGDLDPAEARRLIQQYFGDIPRGAEPPAVTCRQAVGAGAIHRDWPDPRANLPAVLVAYRLPGYAHDDTPALEVLAAILGQGESSRINQRVVREQRLATFSITATNPAAPRQDQGVMLSLAVSNQGVSADSLAAGLKREYARVLQAGVTQAELDRALNGIRTELITGRQQALVRAEAIQTATLFMGDPEAVNTRWRRILAVTTSDIHRVARTWLTPENSLTLLIQPESSQ